MRLNEATPLSSQATASPSMMQEREPQAGQRLDDQREAMGEVITRTAVEPHLRVLLAGNDAEAAMLDFMQRRRAAYGFGWETRRDEPGREGTLQHVEKVKSRNDYRNIPLLTARVLARIGFGHWRVQLRLGQPRPVGRWPYGRAGELFSGHF